MTRLGEAATRAALAVGVLLLALDHGGYGSSTRGALGILAWWALLLLALVGAWPRELSREALVAGGLLAGFCGLTGLSALWGDSAELAFVEFARASLYLAGFTVVVLVARRGSAAVWVDGIGAGIAAVGALALLARCLDFERSGELSTLLPGTEARLSFPLGYWNGLGILLAIGIPLLLRSALESRSAWARGAAAGALPALGAAVYLTSSRGAAAVGLAGALTFVLVAGRAVPALIALAVGGAGTALAIASLEAVADGVAALLLVLACCGGAGLMHAQLTRGPLSNVRLSRRSARLAVVAALLAALAGAAAADPAERVSDFKEPPNLRPTSRPDFIREHLLGGGGSGRWQFWGTALDQFEQHPIAGAGAGSFQAWWLAHGDIDFYARDAHSLYFETLGELGLSGFLFLTAAFATTLVAAARRVRAADELRTTVAAAAAGFVSFLVGAAVDWIWELTVVAAVGILCMGLLCGRAVTVAAGRSPQRSGPRAGSRIVLVGVSLVLIAAEAIPWASAHELEASRDALARGDAAEAQDRASAASALQPWAASPLLQLALIYEYDGEFGRARRAIQDALRHERNNWQLWVVAARIDAVSGRARAASAELTRARALHPHSPLFARPDDAAQRKLERALGGRR